jgi:prepilin-type N-terminal cleavage/methylation domain-containing protein
MPARAKLRDGMTLIELMVTLGATSVVMAGALGVYFFTISQWSAGSADLDAYTCASEGMAKMCKDIESGVSAQIITVPGGRELLKVWVMPAELQSLGVDYFPDEDKSGRSVTVQDEYWFYLSDSTGSIFNSGNILWRAHSDPVSGYVSDPGWSLYYGTSRGRVSGVSSLDFNIDPDHHLVYIAMTVKGTEAQKQLSRCITRWVEMRNHADW